MNARRSPEQALPVAPYVAYILKILSRSEHHAYAIFKQLRKELAGKSVIGTTTLYRLIERMVQDQLIVESDKRPDPALDDERRTYFRITEYGEEVLKAEVARMRQFADDWEASCTSRAQADPSTKTEQDPPAAPSRGAAPNGHAGTTLNGQHIENLGATHVRHVGRPPNPETS